MSKDDIEKRIRTLFYLLLGITFSFLFILTSSYLDLNKQSNQNTRKQTLAFLVDGLQTRERFIYEDYHSHSYDSISLRIKNFLEPKGITDFRIAILSGHQCTWGEQSLCTDFETINFPNNERDILVHDSMDKVNLLIPIQGWLNDQNGRIALEIKSTQISPQQTLYDKLIFQILPFACLFLISITIYYYTEKSIIKPTIRRIIEGEKLQTQKDMVRQFAHDIRSPIAVLEEIVDCAPFNDEDANILVADALKRIKGIANDLLTQEKKLNQSTNLKLLIERLVNDKKLEYKNRELNFTLRFKCLNDVISINSNDLYRALSNLINNSIESVIQGPISISICVVHTHEGTSIEISDNGNGISKELLPVIERGGFTSKQNGNGLGLKGVKSWLTNLNGQFTIDSEVGLGTKVLLQFPPLA